MSLKDAFFGVQKLPIKPVQQTINKRPQKSSKFKRIAKNFTKLKVKTGPMVSKFKSND